MKVKFNFSYKPKTKLGRKIGEKLHGKEIYIGLPRYEKNARVANIFDIVLYATAILAAHHLFVANRTILAGILTAVMFIYLEERFEGAYLAKQKKAGAAE